MKRKVQNTEQESELNGRNYWRSLDELAGTPGFKDHLNREFPEGASNLDGVNRRNFFKLMAASFALGGIGLAAGCRRPDEYILPYGKSVEGVIPGMPLYFATAMPMRKEAIPLLAETHQGRPTKLEGNPTYTPHGGGSSLLTQASVLDLYDPDRATTHLISGNAATVGAVRDKLAQIGTQYSTNGGAGLAFLSEESSSSTKLSLVAQLKAKFPQAVWAEYEPLSESANTEATVATYGAGVKPIYRFAKAKRVLSIDSDFLGTESGNLYYSREFAKARRVRAKDDEMNRLYAVESVLTLTGGMADHRLRLASSHMLAFAGALAAKLTGNNEFAALAQGLDIKAGWIDAAAADLAEHKGESLVVAGSHLPAAVHALVYAINVSLGNVGSTVDFVQVPATSAASITDLVNSIKAGTVKTLVILGGNPAYNAPADLDWAAAQKIVPEVVRYSYYVDETSLVKSDGTTQIAAAHYLESWGDARAFDGTIVPIQPMILPLFNGLTDIEVLARILGNETADPYTLVYNTITRLAGGDAAKTFRQFLHDGVLANSAYPAATPSFNVAGAVQLANSAPKYQALSSSHLEVRFLADHKMDDGRFANNGWLQECPDPITKISWDNAISISPRLAKELNVYPKGSALQVARVELAELDRGGREMAYIAEVTLNGRKIRGPLHIQPGLSNYTVVLPLGYGRTVSGRIGKGTGFDAYPLRTSQGLYITTGATIEVKREERFELANVQDHWSMEGRDLVRESNLEGPQGFRENPNFVFSSSLEAHSPSILGEEGSKMPLAELSKEIPRGNSLYVTPKFSGLHQWGMAIDLNTCTGCNACVVACQAENNIPIVGKDQALRGREMHWIRLDRYYADGNISPKAFGGDENREIPEDPQVSVQPIACMQCELAPCETVCPVNATVHDDEGLNAMAYNRCIGTRYCANNCPYKVRRFNYFDFNNRQIGHFYSGPIGPEGLPELVKMVKNPEVTLRMRGVMEKCTFCVQRIEHGKINQKVKAGASGDVKVPDGAIKTACQQVCPVEAIVFGDITDENSEVSKAKARAQNYSLLGNLNTRPRLTYLAKLRNPNPKMPDYAELPFGRKEFNLKNRPAGMKESPEKNEGPAGREGPAPKESSHASLPIFKTIGGLS